MMDLVVIDTKRGISVSNWPGRVRARPTALRLPRSMSTETAAELERSASRDEQFAFNARAVLAGNTDDTTVRQAVLVGRVDR